MLLSYCYWGHHVETVVWFVFEIQVSRVFEIQVSYEQFSSSIIVIPGHLSILSL